MLTTELASSVKGHTNNIARGGRRAWGRGYTKPQFPDSVPCRPEKAQQFCMLANEHYEVHIHHDFVGLSLRASNIPTGEMFFKYSFQPKTRGDFPVTSDTNFLTIHAMMNFTMRWIMVIERGNG